MLLQFVAQGDELAFGQLYEHWQPQLASFIFRITKSKEIAAEIVQDVFLKIWINRELLSGIDQFKSYLFVVCRNHALNALRKAVREFEQFQELETINFDKTSPDDEDTETNRLTIVDIAIDKLSPRQKEIYLLHRHEGFTYHQIAAKLGIGKETVKTHLDLAVKSITEYIKSHITLLALIAEFCIKKF